MLFAAADRILDHLSERGLGRLYRLAPPALVTGLARYRFHRTVRWVAKRSAFYREAFRAGVSTLGAFARPRTWAISSPHPTI